jgi:nitroreductase
MDALEVIETRASAVRLEAPGPSPEHLERILKSAIRAPDHGRLNPWRFVVIEGAAREILADAMADLRKRNSPDATDEQLESERTKARRAPTIIVAAARIDRQHKVPEIEQTLAVAACVQNMFLSAHALGYGVMWKTGDAAYDPRVKTTLGLSADDNIVAFLYVGTALAKGRVVKTQDLDRFVVKLQSRL